VILDVPALVHLAALDECTLAEDRADRRVERLAAVDHEEYRALGTQVAPFEIGEQALTRRRVLRRALVKAEHVLVARAVNAERDENHMLADVQTVDHHGDQVDLAQFLPHQRYGPSFRRSNAA
jgi:hypothetical protein